MRKKINYYDDLTRDLKNPRIALAYLNDALEQSDKDTFLLALRDVAQAWGGMTRLSRLSKRPRISLYKILSKRGNPELQSLDHILRSMGFRLAIMGASHSKLRQAA